MRVILVCSILAGWAPAEDQPARVSVIELLATPEKFDGKLVGVTGFLIIGERSLLYLHREDVEHALPNGILVTANEDMRRRREELNGMYVVVVGMFHAVPAAGGGPVRVIKDVNRNFRFELPLRPKTYVSYPVVSTANSSGLFEVVVRLILAVLRSRCAGFARPSLPRR